MWSQERQNIGNRNASVYSGLHNPSFRCSNYFLSNFMIDIMRFQFPLHYPTAFASGKIPCPNLRSNWANLTSRKDEN